MSLTSVWAMTWFSTSSSLLSWLVSFSVFPSLTWSKLFCWWLLWCPAPMLTLEHPLSITWNHWFPYPWLCYSSTLLFPRFLLISPWPCSLEAIVLRTPDWYALWREIRLSSFTGTDPLKHNHVQFPEEEMCPHHCSTIDFHKQIYIYSSLV